MLTKRVIPCLDCKNGKVVKGVKFQNLVEIGSPAELALRYEEQGADEIVLLDIGATVEERETQINTVKEVRKALSIPLTVGGGIRSINDVESLLQAGADKVSLNTAAFLNPQLIYESSQRFGSQCVVVAIDARKLSDSWEVLTRSGTKSENKDVCMWAKEASQLGAGEILLTSFDRDGTKNGYDLLLLEAVSKTVAVPIIASGGARTPKDLLNAFKAGAEAVLAASIFHYQEFTVRQIKEELTQVGVQVRL